MENDIRGSGSKGLHEHMRRDEGFSHISTMPESRPFCHNRIKSFREARSDCGELRLVIGRGWEGFAGGAYIRCFNSEQAKLKKKNNVQMT